MAQFNIETNISDVSSQVSGLTSLVGGPLVKAVQSARAAWVALDLTFKATGIGLIISAVAAGIALLVNGLQRFQPVIDAFSQAWTFASTAVEVAADNLLRFLGILDGASRNILDTARRAAELEAALQRLEQREIDLIVTQSKLNAISREALLLSSDQTLSEEERIKQLGIAETAIRQQFENERAILDERIAIQTELLEQSNNRREDERELNELIASRADLDANEATMLKEITGLRTGLIKTIQRENEARDELNRSREESDDETLFRRQQEINEAQGESAANLHAARIFFLEDERVRREEELQELIDNQASKEAIAAAEGRVLEAKDEEAEAYHQGNLMRIKAEREADDQLVDARIANVGALGDFLTTIAGENKSLAIAGLIVEQAAGVAAIVVDTLKASARALADLGPVVGAPVATAIQVGGALSVGSAIAATVQGIKAINEAPGPAASGVAGGGGASGVAFGPTVATPATGAVQQAQAPALTQSTQQMQPIVLLTPTSGPGSLESSTRANDKRNLRRRL